MTEVYNQQALVKTQTDVARMESEISHLTDAVEELKKSNAAMRLQLEEIRTLLSEARGGWRVMMFVGGAFMTLGAVFAWVLQHVQVKP